MYFLFNQMHLQKIWLLIIQRVNSGGDQYFCVYIKKGAAISENLTKISFIFPLSLWTQYFPSLVIR